MNDFVKSEDVSDKWISCLYASTAYPEEHRKVARDLMRFIIRSLNEYDLSNIDKILSKADPSKLSRHAISALLRSTGVVKHLLPNWVIFKDAVVSHFESQGEYNSSLLVGII